MIIAIKFAQSVIALFQEVVKVEFTPKVTETIVQYFVSNLRVFIACQCVNVLVVNKFNVFFLQL